MPRANLKNPLWAPALAGSLLIGPNCSGDSSDDTPDSGGSGATQGTDGGGSGGDSGEGTSAGGGGTAGTTGEPAAPTLDDARYSADDQWPTGTVVGALPLTNPDGVPVAFEVAPQGVPFTVDAAANLVVSGALDHLTTPSYAFDVTMTAAGETTMARVDVRVTTTAHQDEQTPALGEKRAIWIRGQFDGTFHQQTEEEIADAMISLNRYVERESFGQISVDWDVTPYIETGVAVADMPEGAWEIRDVLVNAAIAEGVDVGGYDYVYLSMPTGIITGGGALGTGDGASGTAWVPAPLWTPGTVHESFHVFGVGHAEVLIGDQSYPAPQGAGGSDPYFFMGSEGGDAKSQTTGDQYDIHAAIPMPMKYRMGWLRKANLPLIQADGEVHRVYTTRYREKLGLDPLGLRFELDGQTFVASYEPAVYNTRLKTAGVIVHLWSDAVTRLVDANPASIPDDPDSSLNELLEMTDAAISLGTSVDMGEVVLEFVAAGGSREALWADVRLRRAE